MLTTRIFTQCQRTFTLSVNQLICSSITILPAYPPDTLRYSILSNLHCYASKITEIFQIFLHFSRDEAQSFVSSMFRSKENFHQSAHKSARAENSQCAEGLRNSPLSFRNCNICNMFRCVHRLRRRHHRPARRPGNAGTGR